MLKRLHRWVGLVLMLPLLIEASTGTVLVVAPLFTDVRPHASVATTAGAASGIESLVAAAEIAGGAHLRAIRVDTARWPGDSAAVFLAPPGERHATLRVTIDPSDAAVTGQSRSPAVLRLVHDLHARFLLLRFGAYATSLMGTLLFGLASTGILLWWPHPSLWRSGRWRRTVVPSTKARGARFWRELHLSAGFWCALMLAFLSASGVMMAFPPARALFGVPPPAVAGKGKDARHGLAAENGVAGLNKALLLLMRDHPGARLQSIRLGTGLGADRIVAILPERGANHPVQFRPGANGASPAPIADPAETRTGPFLWHWLHLLHETQLAAPAPLATVWTAAVFLCGAGLLVLSLSGTVMWGWRNRTRRKRLRTEGSADPLR